MKIFFNTFTFPTVKVLITNETDDTNKNYDTFMDYWETRYKKKKHFHLLMDLQTLTRPNLGLCLDFIRRQKEMKKEPIQYLDYSVVVVNNRIVHATLNMLWNLCPPLNTVYLVTEMSIALTLLNSINSPLYSKDYIATYIEMYNITKI